MLDGNWDLVNGPEAHQIEFLNYTNQVNVIESMFRLFMSNGGQAPGDPCPLCPNAAALKALHYTGTLFLLDRPGEFREIHVELRKPDGTVVHTPPDWPMVPQHMADFERDLIAIWPNAMPMEIASFCLWRINWIHPFVNGNGRTARAFAYACLCLRYGFMLPGQPTILDLIMVNKPEFEAALIAADQSYAVAGAPDLKSLTVFIERLFVQQLSSIPVEAPNPPA
jgi:hypothetical protein